MKVNLNDDCRVKLTDHGRERLKEDHYDFFMRYGKPDWANDYTPPREDADGWSTWQMWDLMAKLGKYLGVGTKNVFELDIEIVENEGDG